MTLRIWLLVAAATALTAFSPMGVEGAVTTPSNGLVAFASGLASDEFTDDASGIGVVSPDGTGRRLLTHGVPGVGQPTWSADGRLIALALGSSIAIMNADGGGFRTVTRPPGARDTLPAWGPRGQLAYLRSGPDGASTALMLTDAEGREARTAFLARSISGQPVWGGDGRSVAVLTDLGGNVARVFDISSGRRALRSFARRCVGVPIPAPRRNAAVCLGRSALSTPTHLWLIDAHRARLLAKVPKGIGQPAWSRDGKRVAYAVGFRAVVVLTLSTGRSRTFDLDLREPKHLSRSLPQLAWSPDGGHVVVGQSWGPGWRVVTLDTRTGANQLLIGHTRDVSPLWSPDGRTLAYLHIVAPKEAELHVRTLDEAGQAIAPGVVAPADGWGYTWSPDSRALAYVTGTGTLATINAAGAEMRTLATDASSSPAWSPDGSTIAYATRDVAIRLIRTDGSASPLPAPPSPATAPAWSPDGMNLFYVAEHTTEGDSAGAVWQFPAQSSRYVAVTLITRRGAFSPDGNKLYTSSRLPDGGEGVILDFRDAPLVVIGYAGPGAWAPDGTAIAFWGFRDITIAPIPATGNDLKERTIIAGASDPSWQPLPK
jgi:Tol biopolymer transport system component